MPPPDVVDWVSVHRQLALRTSAKNLDFRALIMTDEATQCRGHRPRMTLTSKSPHGDIIAIGIMWRVGLCGQCGPDPTFLLAAPPLTTNARHIIRSVLKDLNSFSSMRSGSRHSWREDGRG